MHFTLLKYLKSFSDGRIRIRHPALKREDIATLVQQRLPKLAGITSVECNTLSGSVLILYEPSLLSKETLMDLGTTWALYLDEVAQGRPASPPAVP